MKRVLITGGLGSIGFPLAKKLSEQYEITIADNMVRGRIDSEVKELLTKKNVKFVKMDITDRKQFRKLRGDYDYVYHLAAINGTKNFYERPVDVLRVGVLGTLNVLDWFKDRKGKILFSSSNEAYASWITLNEGPIPTPERVPLCIDNIFNKRWSYGAGKIIGEVLFANYGMTYGFPYTIVRYHNSYGPRMGKDHVIPQFIDRIKSHEEPFKIFGADETRSFCYIDDTIRATQMVMESPHTNGEIVHIGNDEEEISMVDLAKMMFDLLNYTPKKLDIKEAPEGCVKRRCPDLTKITRLVGYTPSIGLEEGLIKTIHWYEKIS
jgi:nucleoside-diphosphate-sugar epimerase